MRRQSYPRENASLSHGIQQHHLLDRTLAGKVDAGCWPAKQEISAHVTVKQNLKRTMDNMDSLFLSGLLKQIKVGLKNA